MTHTIWKVDNNFRLENPKLMDINLRRSQVSVVRKEILNQKFFKGNKFLTFCSLPKYYMMNPTVSL